MLKILEIQDTETRQHRAFKKFVRDYGTHYLSSTFLGSKISAQTYFSSYERLKYDKKTVGTCAEVQARKKLNVKYTGSDKNDNVCFGENDAMPPTIEDRTVATEFGMRPDANSELKNWKSKKQAKPIPIKFELTPIVNLFTVENLDERYNISSSKIMKWFLPLYIKYCKVA